MALKTHLFIISVLFVLSSEANVHEKWAAHITESPVAAAAFNHSHEPHPSLRPAPSTASAASASSTATTKAPSPPPPTLQAQIPSPKRKASGLQPASEARSTTDVTPSGPTEAHRGAVKKVELITRRPSEERPKRRKVKGKPPSTESPQNDFPHQESQTSWGPLVDKPRQLPAGGSAAGESRGDDAIPAWALRIQSPRGPDFSTARSEWGKYWPIHVYSSGSVFALLSAVNAWQLISKLFSSTRLLLSKGRFACVSFLMLTSSSLRATFLLADPYNADRTYPAQLLPVVVDLPLFCLATCFAIEGSALLGITSERRSARPWGKLAVADCVLLSGGVGFILLAALRPRWSAAQLLPRGVFVLWTSLTCLCFLCAFKRVQRSAARRHGEALRATFTKLHIEGADLPRRLPRPTLCVAARIALVNAVLLLAMNAVSMYGLVAVSDVLSSSGRRVAEPWPWWSFQLVLRMLEATVSVLITHSALETRPEGDSPRDEPACCALACGLGCCGRRAVVRDYDSCSDVAYGFRNENFNTSLDFSNVAGQPVGQQPAGGPRWGRGAAGPPALPRGGRLEENTASKSHGRSSLLSHPIQALSSLGSGRQSRFATNSTVESSQRHSTILFRDKLRRSGPPPGAEAAQLCPTAAADAEGDDESIRAQMGSRVHSISEEDAMLLSSPFFPRFKRSHCSSLDNSIDVSSDQLSSLGPGGGELAPHQQRRALAGSTCSSESAANSFDVAFFLNSNPPLDHGQAVAAQREFMERLVRHEQERHLERSSQQDDRRRFFEEYDRIQEEIRRERALPPGPQPRSISPIVSARSSSRKAARRDAGEELHLKPQPQPPPPPPPPPSMHKMSLDLAPSGVVGTQPAQQSRVIVGNTADEDITPDSAVYLDLQLSPSDESPAGDLHIIHNSFNSLKRASRSFLNRINSTFSLSNRSYAPLESADECITYFGAESSGSLDKGQRLRAARSADVLASAEHENLCGLQHGDSGLLVEENSQRSSVLCDSACQTEPLCT